MNLTAQVQTALSALGIPSMSPGGVDGAWGPKTTAAVQAYQASKGQPATGLPEPDLLSSLGIAAPPLSSFPFLGPSIVSALTSLAGLSESLTDPVKIMLHESGMEPDAVYKDSKGNPVAAGIFQLLVNSSNFGPGSFTGKTLAEWLAMTADEQVPFAARFWRGKGMALPLTARNLYWTNYLPATVVQAAPDSYAFVFSDDTYLLPSGKREPEKGVYTMNEGLDHPAPGQSMRKGYIDAGDMGLATGDGAKENPDLYAALAAALAPYMTTTPPPPPSFPPQGASA